MEPASGATVPLTLTVKLAGTFLLPSSRPPQLTKTLAP